MRTIDTFDIAKQAQEAGFNNKQTEFFIHTVNTIEKTHISNLATKNDLLLVEERLRNEISDCRKDFAQEISSVRNEISDCRKDFAQEISSVRNEISSLRKDLKIFVLANTITIITVIVAALGLFKIIS